MIKVSNKLSINSLAATALENALKLSQIKAEGFEVMMGILKDEYGIDLSKKREA